MRKHGHVIFDLGENIAFLLDLRFADDTLLLARTVAESIGRSGTQIAEHRSEVRPIFLAYPQWK